MGWMEARLTLSNVAKKKRNSYFSQPTSFGI